MILVKVYLRPNLGGGTFVAAGAAVHFVDFGVFKVSSSALGFSIVSISISKSQIRSIFEPEKLENFNTRCNLKTDFLHAQRRFLFKRY